MIVGIVGLGLIGGSFAKAYHEAGWKVLAHNRSKSVLDFAKISGAVDDELTKENICLLYTSFLMNIHLIH